MLAYAFKPQHFRMLRIDGIHFYRMFAVQQILQKRVPNRTGAIGSADHGHRRGREHGVQAVGLEGLFLISIGIGIIRRSSC